MEVLAHPTREEAQSFLDEFLPSLSLTSRALLLVGRCRVDYEGRASSRLEAGDRVVLVKSDGSLLIHNPTGFKPVNWQPPGCEFQHTWEGPELLLEARRAKPPETVRLRFLSLALLASPRMEADAPLTVSGTEFDIRDTLRKQPSLVEPGFVPWERERITERGPMDLYGEDAKGRRVVVEIKRTRAGLAEATQLWRYVERERAKRGPAVRGLLVAPACSVRALALLSDHGLEFRALDWGSLKPTAERVLAKDQPTLLSFARRDQTKKP